MVVFEEIIAAFEAASIDMRDAYWNGMASKMEFTFVLNQGKRPTPVKLKFEKVELINSRIVVTVGLDD